MASSPRYTRFVRIGSEVARANLNASSSSANALGATGTAASAVSYFGSPYSNFGFRVQLSGAATSGTIQLLGLVGTTSDAVGAMRPLTTWDGSVNTSDDTIWITGKPVTQVAAAWTTASSSGTSANIWIAGTA